MSRSTEELIRDLASDLPPVKPLARVRTVVAMVIGVSLPFYAGAFVSHGLRPPLGEPDSHALVYVASALTLLLLAAGGLISALTSSIPGRESDARAGRLVLTAGVGLTALLLFAQWFPGAQGLLDGLVSGRGCITAALLLAVPAGLVVGRYVMRGAARSLPAALAAGFAGGAGLAGIVVHLTCPHTDPLHMVLGHAAAPLYGGVALMALASLFAGFEKSGA